jgi:hypothetical protein
MSPWVLLIIAVAVWYEAFSRLRYTPPGRHRAGIAPGMTWDRHAGVTEEGLWPGTPAPNARP